MSPVRLGRGFDDVVTAEIPADPNRDQHFNGGAIARRMCSRCRQLGRRDSLLR